MASARRNATGLVVSYVATPTSLRRGYIAAAREVRSTRFNRSLFDALAG
jgi:hypothetical protein